MPGANKPFKQAAAGPVNANVTVMKAKPTPMASSLGGQFAAMENALLKSPKKKKPSPVMKGNLG